MIFEEMPVLVQNMTREAAELADAGKPIHLMHSQDAYKALSDVFKQYVTRTYYEAIQYYQKYSQEERNITVNNIDLLV